MYHLAITSFNQKENFDQFSNYLKRLINIRVFDKIWIDDDGSFDGTVDLLRSLQAEHPALIKLISHKDNSGRPARGRNAIIERISSGTIVFLDFGDYIETTSLLAALRYYHEQNDSRLIITGTKVPFEKLRIEPQQYSKKKYPARTKFVIAIPAMLMAKKNLITFSGAIVSSELAKKARFQNEFLEDWRYWLRLSNIEDVKFQWITNYKILYDNKSSLSPSSLIQVKRVYKILGYQIIFYLIIAALFKWVSKFAKIFD